MKAHYQAHYHYAMGGTGKAHERLILRPSEGEVIAALRGGKVLGRDISCSATIAGGGSNDSYGNTVGAILHVAGEIEKRYGFSPKLPPDC